MSNPPSFRSSHNDRGYLGALMIWNDVVNNPMQSITMYAQAACFFTCRLRIMADMQKFISVLVKRFPSDADELQDALKILQHEKFNSLDRLRKLNDSQWQRLGLRLGIETILREALQPQPPEDPPSFNKMRSRSRSPPWMHPIGRKWEPMHPIGRKCEPSTK